MLWRRRNEGFEWKDYVRTTVLLRRRQRREKIDAARHAAADGLKEAGRQGLAVGAAGAQAAGRGAAKIASSAADHAAHGAERGLAVLASGAGSTRDRIAAASAPLNARLSHPTLSRTFATVAVIAGATLAVRATQFGFDADAVACALVAAVAVVLWAWPRVFAMAQLREPDETARAPGTARETIRSLAARVPAASLVPLASAAGLAVLMAWLAAPTVSGWLSSAPPPQAGKSDPADGDSLTGTARVAGPATLRIAGTQVRLAAITMLEPNQTCRRPDGASWSCGQAARSALERALRGRRPVVCSPSGSDGAVRLATCRVDGRDIAAELVRGGHAFADGTFWATYAGEEAEARTASAGLWAGEAERPDDWRARLWEEARAAAPGGCPIKGRIQSGRRLYVLPHASDYGRISVREARGERWFCSPDEAEAAGFSAGVG